MHPASTLRAGTPPDAGRRADCAGHIALELKRVWHDGTRELVFEPLEFLEWLAAIIPTAGKELADLPRLTGPARPLARASNDLRTHAARAHGLGAGVVNAALGAQAQFPSTPIDAVLGGYHLSGKATEARIEATVRDLRTASDRASLHPGTVRAGAPRWRWRRAFVPERYSPSVVGASYTLRSTTG